MTSFLGRVNYNYNDLYYAGVSYRRDGSSRMARENRWGSFWSVSGAWRFGAEKFMDLIKGYIDDKILCILWCERNSSIWLV